MNYSSGRGYHYDFDVDPRFRMMNPCNSFNQQPAYAVTSSFFRCETCAKMFMHKDSYDRHVLGHDVEKVTGVPQGFSSISGTGINMASSDTTEKLIPSSPDEPDPLAMTGVVNAQSRPKLHACDECPKSYTRKDHLNRHKLWHKGDKPHVCSVCFKAFVRKDKLVRHERIHVRDCVCNCGICGKEFWRKDAMKKHLRTHEAKLPGPRKRTVDTSQQTDITLVSNTFGS